MLTANKKTALYSAVVSFLTYTCIFSFRKEFSAASFSGQGFWEMDYKVIMVVTQVAGYWRSVLYSIQAL